jgi:glucose/arabinose dehydrogenase
MYTYENNPSSFSGRKTGRVARYTVTGDTASVGSQVVILGTAVGSSCNNFSASADCLPSDSPSHSVGNLKFASDGALFVTVGDGAHFNFVDDDALRAQNLDLLAGKMLRVTKQGRGLPDNPFWNGNASANRSKVWTRGLRNSYRFGLRPGTNVPLLGDVGWNNWEEVNVGARGANLGWPCYEGVNRQAGYEPKPVCQALYGQGTGAIRAPLVTWDHAGQGSASTGGAFYTGTAYPTQYRGAFFYADYARGWIRYLQVDANNNLVGSAQGFATGAGSPTGIEMGPDGSLYYVAFTQEQIRRIRYTAGNTPPTARASATPSAGPAPLNVQLSSAGSSDPDPGDVLSYSWSFGDGTPASAAANPSHTYTTNGTYTATLTVRDSRGGMGTATVVITAGNRPPSATISAPTSTSKYKVGDTINYAGSATDPDPGDTVSLSWAVIIQHCSGGTCHQHPFTTGSGSGGSFVAPDHGDDSRLEIRLTATDRGGLSDAESVLIWPRTTQITLSTSPTGLQVVYDGETRTGPSTLTTIVGSTHSIHAPSPQNGNRTYASWSDGGAQQHNITVGENGGTYTATFTAGGSETGTTWSSQNVVTTAGATQATVGASDGTQAATLELYQSANDGGVDPGRPLSAFTSGQHVSPFNHAERLWSFVPGGGYPYVGKSTVDRGGDAGETGAPAPTGPGVRDLQLHPPDSPRLIVAAFRVPVDGTYEVADLAARRVHNTGHHTSRLKLFNPAKMLVASVQANSQAWTRNTSTYNLGALTAGQKIYFAADRDNGTFAYDATEVIWTVRRR